MKTEKEMAEELYENFEEITGFKPEDAFYKNGEFDDIFIEITINDLVEYGFENFGIDIRNDDTLFELDKIMKIRSV